MYSLLSFWRREDWVLSTATHGLTLSRMLASVIVLLGVSCLSASRAATLPAGFAETLIANVPNGTAMAFAPDGRLFVCQQTGELRVIKNGALLGTPFVSLTVDSSGERGLLGVAFDPNFATNQFVYVYYTTPSPSVHNRVSRFTANGDVAAAGELVILELNNLSGATNHNGGAIHFGTDGKLYIAVGENANPAHAQSFGNLLGKMLRINPDPTDLIPADNPFFNNPNVIGNNKAIWALGLRNPFTFGIHRSSGRIFINDVGQGAFEEINDGIAASNYGWSICEGACTQPNPNFRDPIFQYANDASTCAIAGGTFYVPPSPQFPPTYVGKYFYADLCGGWIRVLDPSNNTSASFATGLSNPVDLQVANDGSLYYLMRGGGGQVYRIFSTAPTIAQGRKTGVFRSSTGELFLKNSNSSGFADTYVIFGNPGDYPIAGDWNGDGVDSVGIYRNGVFYLRNSNTTGFADIVIPFGNAIDQPVVGDWNGDGVDTIGIYRNDTFYLRNSNTAGAPDLVFTLGNPGDVAIAGDWNGDGIVTAGVFRPSNGIIYLKNSNTTGFADISFVFGNAGDQPVAGDWDGDGIDTIGIYRNGLFYLSNSNTTGFADIVFVLGNNGDSPIAGNWNGSPITGTIF